MARGMAQWINKSIMDGRRADSVFGLGLGNPFFNSLLLYITLLVTAHGWIMAVDGKSPMGGWIWPWVDD